MKKIALALLGLFMMAGIAGADARIEEVLVRRKGQDMNIRVNLRNTSSYSQRGIVITLYARPNSESEWERVKVWRDIGSLPAGNRVARDFFEAGSAKLQAIASNPAFEARAVVEAPGMPTDEKIGIFSGDDH